MYIDWFDILKKHVKKCDFTGTGFSQKKLLSSCCQIDRIWSNKYVAHCSTAMNSDSAEGHGRNLRVRSMIQRLLSLARSCARRCQKQAFGHLLP